MTQNSFIGERFPDNRKETEMNASYIDSIANELLRVAGQKGVSHTFTLPNGETIQGATESDTIKHLTSGREFVAGRQFRFPGVGSGWNFSGAVEAAGFRIVSAKNFRGQTCRVVTI
jgi:hypothetical protein